MDQGLLRQSLPSGVCKWHSLQPLACTLWSLVPQGSVLGPVLLLLYIIDITDPIQSTMRLLADDSIVYREIKKNTAPAGLSQLM